MFAAHNAFLTASGKPPVAFENISTGGTGAISSASWSHTVPANASVLIVVSCLRGAVTGSATVDGVSMTKVIRYAPRDTIEVYAVLNPTAGTRSIYASGGAAVYGNYYALTYSNCGSVGTTYTSYGTGSITFANANNSSNLFIGTERNAYSYALSAGTTRAVINGGATISSIIGDLNLGGTVSASGSANTVCVGITLNGI